MADIVYPEAALGPLHPAAFDAGAPEPAQEAPNPDLVRRAAALARWRRRSRQVQFFRKALPAAIGAIVVLGVGWVGVRALLSALARADKELGSIHLINPSLLWAATRRASCTSCRPARRCATGATRTASPWSSRTCCNGPAGAPAPMTTQALHGVYHEAHKLLDLTGNVVATDGQGYTFESQLAHINMRLNSAAANAHVYSDGRGLHLADAYQVYDKGQHAIFTGHVHTHLTTSPTSRDRRSPPPPRCSRPAPSPCPTRSSDTGRRLPPCCAPPFQKDPAMRRLSVPGAAAALCLLAAGAASALPPEPASAPRGAHVAAAPPPAAVPANGAPGLTPDGKSERADRHHLRGRGDDPAAAPDHLPGQRRGHPGPDARPHPGDEGLQQAQARRGARPARGSAHALRADSSGAGGSHRGDGSVLLRHAHRERPQRLHGLRVGAEHHHPDRPRRAGAGQERRQGRQADHLPGDGTERADLQLAQEARRTGCG